MTKPLSTEFDDKRMLLDTGIAESVVLYYAQWPSRDMLSSGAFHKVFQTIESDFHREYNRVQYHFPAHGGYRVTRNAFHKENGGTWFLIQASLR